MTINPVTILLIILVLDSLAIIRLMIKVRRLNRTLTGLLSFELFKVMEGNDRATAIIKKLMNEKKGEKKDAGQS
ncbi:MAG: hypothetical protein K6E94_04190 [Elusimicrobiaceae bacterium]|nr:hypothetical protein [Elusimicrobiaceae bacterium]